mmetsp:Transcript_20957/g.38258  ORF Transcript_20957/g.38258 Transcript_20957/m.38258 type:complete len:447 (+) Transcript_20957:51-1391(+)
MTQELANTLRDKLVKGKECEADAKRFIGMRAQVPDALLFASLGSRQSNTPACPRTLKVLLEGRADVHAKDPVSSGPAIHTACWQGSLEAVKLLLEFQADIEAKDPRMQTPPLNTALAAGSSKVCIELLDRHADVQWTHHDGATPLHVATAWIASSHNANLRLPPVGEEPREVIAKMLHNGVDPTQTEGMTRNQNRGKGMTPLESFRREVQMSPWRKDPEVGPKFDSTANRIHSLLEQGERAVSLKNDGNAKFKNKKYEDALVLYKQARDVWKAADVAGHHTAVLWSNEAKCHFKLEAWQKCIDCCDEGLKLFCTSKIKDKLQETQAEARAELTNAANGIVKEQPPPVEKRLPTKLAAEFLEKAERPLYSKPSEQGKVDKPGPFICNFEEARKAGMVDGVDGERDKQIRAEQRLDQQLVKDGYMSADLLDDESQLDLINKRPVYENY